MTNPNWYHVAFFPNVPKNTKNSKWKKRNVIENDVLTFKRMHPKTNKILLAYHTRAKNSCALLTIKLMS
jgi:hypothetical protein